MQIEKTNTVMRTQEAFSKLYPGLQIRFYTNSHGDYEGSQKDSEIPASTTLAEISPNLSSGSINVDPDTPVSAVEHEFKDKYDINVQIFRRSAELWLQTTKTDDWTLAKQNRKGLHSIQNKGLS